MHVSKNGGDSWDPVQVPTVTPERVTSFHLILNCKIWPGGHINGIGSYLMTSKLTFETFALLHGNNLLFFNKLLECRFT